MVTVTLELKPSPSINKIKPPAVLPLVELIKLTRGVRDSASLYEFIRVKVFDRLVTVTLHVRVVTLAIRSVNDGMIHDNDVREGRSELG